MDNSSFVLCWSGAANQAIAMSLRLPTLRLLPLSASGVVPMLASHCSTNRNSQVGRKCGETGFSESVLFWRLFERAAG